LKSTSPRSVPVCVGESEMCHQTRKWTRHLVTIPLYHTCRENRSTGCTNNHTVRCIPLANATRCRRQTYCPLASFHVGIWPDDPWPRVVPVRANPSCSLVSQRPSMHIKARDPTMFCQHTLAHTYVQGPIGCVPSLSNSFTVLLSKTWPCLAHCFALLLCFAPFCTP
jgi:hypothetical protein